MLELLKNMQILFSFGSIGILNNEWDVLPKGNKRVTFPDEQFLE